MSEDIVKQIRRATRRKFTSEEKIRIVLEGLRGEVPVTDLCRRESITPALYYRWSKDFLDAGKNGLTKNTKRDANSVDGSSHPSIYEWMDGKKYSSEGHRYYWTIAFPSLP